MTQGFTLGKLLVEGTVTDVNVRTGKSKTTGNPYRMESVFVPGRRSVFEVLLPDELQGRVRQGDSITAEVSPQVYQGDVSYRLDLMLEHIDAAGEVVAQAATV